LSGEQQRKLYGFSTRAVHGGQEPDPSTGAVSVPIYATSTFAQTSPGKPKMGYEYSRTKNPTRDALETSIASLENAKHGLAFSSGMGAISTVANLLKSGDSVLISDDIYGGTYRLFTKVLSNFQISAEFVDATNLEELDRAMKKKSYAMLILESPTNPLMKIVDISEASKISHEHQSVVLVDNTFATPRIQTPLDLGTDIVVHSTTKYLGGHSDVVGGAVTLNNEETYTRLKFLQNACGAIPGPFDCYLVLRGIRTLSLRMERHSANAMAIANSLNEECSSGKVARVNYPGLESSEYHKLASRQMRLFGGMLSFKLKESKATRFLEGLKLFTIAESLGGVESLIEIPAIMTHASIPKEKREKTGVSDSLIRMSVGIEDVEDLIRDISESLDKL
jgi:cystathionine beta-lyase/cystathionine gamma-synthase